MPKVIENLEERLIEEAQRQLREAGYSALTVRSLAATCGCGVGTVYNYFPSKDALIAHYLLEEWNLCMERIAAAARDASEPEPVLRCIWDELSRFSENHSALFQDKDAAASFARSFGTYHSLLRSQLLQPLRPYTADDFEAEFLAEALLTWVMAGKSYDEIYTVVKKLF